MKVATERTCASSTPLTLYHTIPTFNDPLKESLKKKKKKNIVGKGENAGNQHFLPFPQCFLAIPKRISVFNLEQCEILSFGKELNVTFVFLYLYVNQQMD